MIYSYTVPATVSESLEELIKFSGEERLHTFIDGQSFYTYTTGINVMDSLEKLAETDDMFEHSIEITLQNKGINFDNNKYMFIQRYNNTERHIDHAKLLKRDFGLEPIAQIGESTYFYSGYCVYNKQYC